MAEMHAISRFFVNRFRGRATERLYNRLRTALALPVASTCLEIGCGNGLMAARIVDGMRPARYVASDVDGRQVDAARRYLTKRYPQGLPAGLELRTADMLQLSFADRAFDAVFAFVVIHHASPSHRDFSNVPRALAEIDRVLRPGGVLAYEEFLHKERIRTWLRERGYTLAVIGRRFARETVVATKSAERPTP